MTFYCLVAIFCKMAGKKSKNSKKNEIDVERFAYEILNNKIGVERFAYDILSITLEFGGFPKEKIICEKGKPNTYRNNEYLEKVSALVMSVELHFRDQWKAMFESRLKSSGLATMEEVEKFLTSVLAITPRYWRFVASSSSQSKVHMSLAAYSEFILFLNYKNIEFDFEEFLYSWSQYYLEKIVGNDNAWVIIYMLVYSVDGSGDLVSFIRNYMQNNASPYGCRDDISTVYREIVKESNERNQDFREVKPLPHLVNPADEVQEYTTGRLILLSDFEPLTVLPGNSESPEMSLTPESGAFGGKAGPRKAQTRSTDVSENRFADAPKALRPGSEMETSVPGDRQSPEPLQSHNSSVDRGKKVPIYTQTESNGVSELKSYDMQDILKPGFEATKTILPEDQESPEQSVNPESGDAGEKTPPRRVQFQSTGVMEYRSGEHRDVLQLGSEAPTPLSGDHEMHQSRSRRTTGVVQRKKLSKAARAGSTGVPELLPAEFRIFSRPETMVTVVPGNSELFAQQSVDGRRIPRWTQTRSTGVSESRPSERQTSRTSPDLEIEDRFKQIDLSPNLS